jgi:hypothetical protein
VLYLNNNLKTNKEINMDYNTDINSNKLIDVNNLEMDKVGYG